MIDESTAPEDRAETMAEIIAGHNFGYYANDVEGLAHAYCSCCFWAWTNEPLDTFTRHVAALSHAEHVADKLREVGVVEPREITTVEEIDALPVGSVVARKLDRPDGGDVYVKRRHLEGIRSLPTPLTVLWTPGGAQ